jgi:hypothetical protein
VNLSICPPDHSIHLHNKNHSITIFRKELFEAAIVRMKKSVIMNEVEIERFRGMTVEVEKLVKLKQSEEQDFEDAPDEFKVSERRLVDPMIRQTLN